MRLRPWASVPLTCLLLLSACASPDRSDRTLRKIDKAERVDQSNDLYRKVNALFAEAADRIDAGDMDGARSRYDEVLRMDPRNPRALASLRALDTAASQSAAIAEARRLITSGDIDGARTRLRRVLVENPNQSEARGLWNEIAVKLDQSSIIPRRLKSNGKRVNLEFRDGSLRNVFEVISRISGVSIVLDPNLNPDMMVSVFLKDASVEDAINFILTTHQLGKKVVSDNSLIIYPLTRVAQYEEQAIRVFYLNHADAKQAAALVKAMLPVRDVFVDEKLNLLSVKAPFDQLLNVERLIADTDVPEPEVILEVEVLEVSSSRLTDLGLRYPNTISFMGGTDPAATTVPLSNLRNLNSEGIFLSPVPSLRLLRTDNDTSLLANPRIRIQNREKAKLHIGDKIPIKTSTISSTGNIVGNSANYLDVGLKLDVEPRVKLNNEVIIKLSLEVSSATQAAGADFPTLSTRNTSTIMMSADNETQVLAGLINDEDRRSANKVPGLVELPLIGRLFSGQNTNRQKTEIILLITPHVIRNVLRPDAGDAEFSGGAAGRMSPANLNPGVTVQAPRSRRAAAAGAAPDAAPPAEPPPQQSLPPRAD